MRVCACLTVLPASSAYAARRRRRRRPSRAAAAARRPSRPMIAARRQVELAPPHDVGGVAERADHRDADALLGIGERGARRTGTRTPNSGVRDLGAEQRLVALVVGMGDERDARGDAARAGWSRSRRRPSPSAPAERAARGTRPAARGPRARPARPPCGSRRPRASAPRPGTPRRARGCAGTRAGDARRARSPMVV